MRGDVQGGGGGWEGDSLPASGDRFLDGHAQPRAGGDDGLTQPLLCLLLPLLLSATWQVCASWQVAVGDAHKGSLLVEEAVGDDGGLARACMEGNPLGMKSTSTVKIIRKIGEDEKE